MAGCPILENGSALYRFSNANTFRRIDSSVEGGEDECLEKLRGLFNHLLSVFLKEFVGRECIRPCPAMLGDGRVVDLFKLFWFVRRRGGYDSVLKNNRWALIVEECGYDLGTMASLKIVYYKYLHKLDQWFSTVLRDKNLQNVQGRYGESLNEMSLELGKQFRGLLTDGESCKTEVNSTLQLDSDGKGRSGVFDIDRNSEEICLTGNVCKTNRVDDNIPSDDGGIFSNCGDDLLISKPEVAKKILVSRKRKRESFSGMLNWVIEVAKHPHNPFVLVSKDSRTGKQESEDFRMLALMAREASMLKRQVDSNAENSLVKKKLKMHPSMYEDTVVISQPSRESEDASILICRRSRRLSSMMKPHLCPCCKPQSTAKEFLEDPKKAEVKYPKVQDCVTVDSLATDGKPTLPVVNPLEKEISVGPLYQAEVPNWTGEICESDSKWLGTHIWPVETKNSETDLIGKGREESCGCQYPGSVNCIRFHTAEKRMKLKLGLGKVFYIWRFDRMGEEVSLSWTVEEEKMFKTVVRCNPPSLDKSFWNDAFRCFPRKSRESLVSYYYNVFLMRRRSYQNRLTPKQIDSDDDEREFGTFSDGFGLKAVKVTGSEALVCSQNEQCFDLV